MTLRAPIVPLCLALLLAGCGMAASLSGGAGGAASRPVERPVVAAETVETDDAAEAAAPEAARSGGRTIATLGDPTEGGLWLRTPLVSVEGPGRIATEDGTAITVTLIPIAGEPGAGSRISLAAMQALGVSLTALVPLVVTPA